MVHRRGAKKPLRRCYNEDDDSSEDEDDVKDGDEDESPDSNIYDRATESNDTGAKVVKRPASTASVESSLFVTADAEPAIEEVSAWGSDSDSDATVS